MRPLITVSHRVDPYWVAEADEAAARVDGQSAGNAEVVVGHGVAGLASAAKAEGLRHEQLRHREAVVHLDGRKARDITRKRGAVGTSDRGVRLRHT